MTAYSTPAEIQAFSKKLGPNPFIICDMDGNVMIGYSLAEGKSLPLGPNDNPQNQAIPFGTSQKQLDQWVEDGILKTAVFATKAMDARLQPELVDLVNQFIETDQPFRLAFLTSRGSKDALTLLRESGVKEPERATLVADSGATMYINGQKHEVRTLSPAEKEFLNQIEGEKPAMNKIARDVIKACGLNERAAPDLFVEHKGIATNVHYREALKFYDQTEGSDLDVMLGTALKDHLQALVNRGPVEADKDLTFKTLDGPATVEVKVAKVNKGHGLEALLKASLEAGNVPSAALFTGDDVSKGTGTPGTDYYAMARAKSLSAETDVPIYNGHTHHADMHGEPDEKKSTATLSKDYLAPKIDLVVPTPEDLGKFIVATLSHAQAAFPASRPAAKQDLANAL